MPVRFITVDELYKREKDVKKEDVQKLAEWAHMQPHLPKITETQLIIFLHSCYYSNEATKTCIDNYYTARALCPEFFANRDPTGEIAAYLKVGCILPLPKKTHQNYRVIYSRLLNYDPNHYSFNMQMKMFDMTGSLFLAQEGTDDGHVIVIDLKGVVLGHLMRINVMSMKKYMFFLQEALPVRLKGFHFINCVSFMDKIMALMKPFMKKEMFDILQIHQSGIESLYEKVPKECLPNEVGGTLGPVSELYETQMKNLHDNVKFFVDEEKEIADESQRPGKPKNAGDVFGVDGTFKKIDID